MSKYILCEVKRAELPYYIKNINTNIYSIEELCFYFYNNLYLLDETIINEELCVWIRDQLGLRKLAQKLAGLLEHDNKLGEFILSVFKEIHYLSMEELRKLNQQFMKMAAEPVILRCKLKGDALMRHGKIVDAIDVYQKVLQDREEEKPDDSSKLGSQFLGTIYHNMGCAYARLFQMEEALACFEKSYEKVRTAGSMKSYLCVVYIQGGIGAFARKTAELDIDEEKSYEILEEIDEAAKSMMKSRAGQMYEKALEAKASGDEQEYYAIMDTIVHDLTNAYRRSTSS